MPFYPFIFLLYLRSLYILENENRDFYIYENRMMIILLNPLSREVDIFLFLMSVEVFLFLFSTFLRTSTVKNNENKITFAILKLKDITAGS